MGTSKRNRDRRVLRSEDRGQENQSKVIWCEFAPTECTCNGQKACKNRGHS